MSSSNVSPRPPKVYSRDIGGLRDALFDEMEDLRSGASASHEAVAFSNLASRVIETVEMEMRNEQMRTDREAQKEERRIETLRLERDIRQNQLALTDARGQDIEHEVTEI